MCARACACVCVCVCMCMCMCIHACVCVCALHSRMRMEYFVRVQYTGLKGIPDPRTPSALGRRRRRPPEPDPWGRPRRHGESGGDDDKYLLSTLPATAGRIHLGGGVHTIFLFFSLVEFRDVFEVFFLRKILWGSSSVNLSSGFTL